MENTPPKKDGRGGARAGAGRPKGSTNKISAEEFFDAFSRHTGQDYLVHMIKRLQSIYMQAQNSASPEEREVARQLAHKYDALLSKYLFHDVQQVDVTSNGETVGVQLNIIKKELADWKADGANTAD